MSNKNTNIQPLRDEVVEFLENAANGFFFTLPANYSKFMEVPFSTRTLSLTEILGISEYYQLHYLNTSEALNKIDVPNMMEVAKFRIMQCGDSDLIRRTVDIISVMACYKARKRPKPVATIEPDFQDSDIAFTQGANVSSIPASSMEYSENMRDSQFY